MSVYFAKFRHFIRIGVYKQELGSKPVKFSNGENGTIQIFQLDGKLVSTFGQQGNGNCQFSGEGHIAYDKNDNLVVSDSDNNRIQVLNSKGIFQRSIGIGDRSGGLNHPVGFTFDESGDHIIVASVTATAVLSCCFAD